MFWGIHKPCLARAAVTSSASVSSCGDSSMLMLPDEDMWLCRWGEVPPDSPSVSITISAPWSTRALATSRKISFWLSILGSRKQEVSNGHLCGMGKNMRFCALTCTFPPPGIWWAFSRERTFAWAFSLKSSFILSICTWPPPETQTES